MVNIIQNYSDKTQKEIKNVHFGEQPRDMLLEMLSECLSIGVI